MGESSSSVSIDIESISLGGEDHYIKTSHGSVTVTVFGDQDKPALITYPDLALNYMSCFQGLLFCPQAASLLLHNFCIYHICPPGHELGAAQIPLDTPVPSVNDLADQVTDVLDFFGLGAVMCLGVTAGAYILSDVGISSDFISGFCGETEEEHADTLSLIRLVAYDMAYMFSYSMREKTHAHRTYTDDVPDSVKQRRLSEVIDAFRSTTGRHFDSQVGTVQLVLVEGPSKRAPEAELIGKSDRGHRVSFVNTPVRHSDHSDEQRHVKIGDYVEVRILKASRTSLFGEPLARTTLSRFYTPKP